MRKTGEVDMTRQKAKGRKAFSHRLTRLRTPESAGFYQEHAHGHDKAGSEDRKQDVVVDCGWGRLLFAQTFETNEAIVEALRGKRQRAATSSFTSAIPMYCCHSHHMRYFSIRRIHTGLNLRPIDRAGDGYVASPYVAQSPKWTRKASTPSMRPVAWFNCVPTFSHRSETTVLLPILWLRTMLPAKLLAL